MATKKKYNTVEENLARRKYYNGTRPVATTSMGMGPVYVNTGDGKTADTYTPSQPHTFNLKTGTQSTANTAANSAPQVPTLDTTNKPTYTPQGALDYKSSYEYKPFEYQSTYQYSPFSAPNPYQSQAFNAPTPYQSRAFNAPEAYKAPDYNSYMSGNYDVGDFKSNWSDRLNSLYSEIAGRGKFTYDQSKDPLYQQYAEMYRKNAQLAMSDTVAKAASLTGGYGNSYAETAGQSMYNQTMDNLNERALDLYDRALNAWALEGDQLNQQFNMAGQMYNNDYNAWRAKMQDAQFNKQFDYNRYLNDRDFGYQQWANDYANAWNQYQYADQMGYQQYRDQYNDAWNQYQYADQMGYQQYRDQYNDLWNQYQFGEQMKYQLDQDSYNRARSAYEYDNNMRYQMDQDAYNRAWQQHTYAGDEARYAYEQANNDWRYANDYALDVYDRNNENYKWATQFDYNKEQDAIKNNQWQQEFDWGKETYNRDDAYRYDQLGYQDKWNQQDLAYNYERLGYEDKWNEQDYNLNRQRLSEDARQYDLSRGDSNYWNRQDDIYRNAQLAEQQRQYNLGYGLDAFNAGYDPATGTYSQANQQRYNDDLALQYAKLGMNPDGTLNAVGQMERDQIAAKQAKAEQKAIEEKKKASGKTGNYYNDDLTYQNVTNWIDSEGGDYSHVLTAAQYAKANAALKKQYPTYKKYLASQIDRRALNKG